MRDKLGPYKFDDEFFLFWTFVSKDALIQERIIRAVSG